MVVVRAAGLKTVCLLIHVHDIGALIKVLYWDRTALNACNSPVIVRFHRPVACLEGKLQACEKILPCGRPVSLQCFTCTKPVIKTPNLCIPQLACTNLYHQNT